MYLCLINLIITKYLNSIPTINYNVSLSISFVIPEIGKNYFYTKFFTTELIFFFNISETDVLLI